MTSRWTRLLAAMLLGVLAAAGLGLLEPGPVHAYDLLPAQQPQPTQPPGEERSPDDPLEPIGPPEDPELFDIPGQVNSSMHGFLASLVEVGMRIVVALLSFTILATPDLTGNEQIQGLWNAMLVVADLTLVLFVVAGGFVVSARETLQTQYGLKEIVPRIVIAGLASNLSLLVVGQLIELVNAFTIGVSMRAIPDGAGAAIAETWDEAAVLTGVNVLSSLLALVIVALVLIVLVTYIVRVAVMVVLIVSGPVVLLFHALPQTEAFAFLWWRALVGCFAIQGGQTLGMVTTFGVFLFPAGSTILGVPASGQGWLTLLMAITMLWLMIKIPAWVKQYLWMNSRGVGRRLPFAVFLFRTMAGATGRRGSRNRGGGTRTSPSERPQRGPTGGSGPDPRRPGPGTRPRRTTRQGALAGRPGRGTPSAGSGGSPAGPGPGGGGGAGAGGSDGDRGGVAAGVPHTGARPAAADASAGVPPAGRPAPRSATSSPTASGGGKAPPLEGVQPAGGSQPVGSSGHRPRPQPATGRARAGGADQQGRPQAAPPVHRPSSWTSSAEPPVRLRTSEAAAAPKPSSNPASTAGDTRRQRPVAGKQQAAGGKPARPQVTPPVRAPRSER